MRMEMLNMRTRNQQQEDHRDPRQLLRRPSEEGYQTAQQVTVDDETVEPIELRTDEMELFVKLMKQRQDESAIQDMRFDLRQKVQAMQVSQRPRPPWAILLCAMWREWGGIGDL